MNQLTHTFSGHEWNIPPTPYTGSKNGMIQASKPADNGA